jgi:group I intron endonuclease
MNVNDKIVGVYCITNLITGKFYIGSSYNLYKRWNSHISNYKNNNSKEKYKKLYIAMRKYGLDNFLFELIENCTDNPQNVRNRELYYINMLDACNYGYNSNIKGENHKNHKLSKNDVIDIRMRYARRERKKEVYKLYADKISKTGFHKVWNGVTWTNIMMNVYTDENKYFHAHNTANYGEENGTHKLSDNDVMIIRKKKKEGLSSKDVYKLYENKITFGSFINIWYNCNWHSIKPVSTK